MALASLSRIRVAIGLLPKPLRNVAVTAMEFATLDCMFPGRVLAGVGHGVQGFFAGRWRFGCRPICPLPVTGVASQHLDRWCAHGWSHS